MKRYWMMAGLVATIGMVRSWVNAGEGNALAEVSSFDNAAMDYWKACALLQEVLNEEQCEIALFVEQDLLRLPSKALAYRPDVGRWLLGERLMLGALNDAAAKTLCVSVAPGPQAKSEATLFRRSMKRLMIRALGAAKAHDFVGNDRGTVSIYVSLLRMINHLGSEDDWVSAYFTLNLLPMLMNDLESYLSRVPPRESLQLLVDELQSPERPTYPMQRMLAKETLEYARWVLEDPATAPEKISSLYGAQILKPGMDLLLTANDESKFAMITQWVDGYRNEMARLGAAVGRPYTEAIQIIREIDGHVAGVARGDTGALSNPLLPLLMPPMAATYEEFLLAEGNLSLLEVMCQCAIYRDFVGDWPDTMETLQHFCGGALRRDPFTDMPMSYDMRGSLPRLELDVPKSLGKKGGLLTGMNLRLRASDDEDALGTLVRTIQKKKKMAEAIQDRTTKSLKKAGRKKNEESKSLRSKMSRGLNY